MGALIRSHDWTDSPLGPPDSWPQSLRSIVGLMLQTNFPMFVAWGPDLRFIYNDGYAQILGAKHPALDCPFRELWWELWHDVEPLVERALSGEAVYQQNLPLTLRRNGYAEPCWFTFSYAPVRDESGAIAGLYCAVTETTAQVLAERNKLAENERLRQLFHQAPGFMCVLRGPEHVFELANAAYLKLIGERDVIGRPVAEAVPEAMGQGFFELLDEVFRTGRSYVGRQARIEIPRPGGTLETRYLDFVYQPITDAQGQVTGIFVEGSDVTEAWQAQQALIENQERLARETHALETLNRVGAQLVGELDVESLVQRVVDAGVELTGAHFGAFFYNTETESGERLMLYTLSGAERADFENFGMPRWTGIFAPTFRGEEIIRSDDITLDPRYGHNSPHHGMPPGHLPVRSYLALPVASRSGEIIGGLLFGHPEPGLFGQRAETVMTGLAAQAAIAIDNARLFQAAQRANEGLEQRVRERTRELAASEARARAFFINSPDARTVIRELPDAFQVVDMNPAALEVIGRRREEVIGACFPKDYSSPLAPSLGRRLQECLASDQPVQYEEMRDSAAGQRFFETILVALDDPSAAPGEGRMIIANSRDITESRRLAEQLRQSQKMEAVGQLTGGLAHDFNNLLAGITGSLELMQARIVQGRTDEVGRFAGAAMTSANRAAALTQRLLAFSRRQTLDPKPVNVNRLVAGMEELIQRTAGPAIRVETVMSGGLWMTLCDPNQLESALLNLAINARDAMPDGGHLTIEAGNTRLDEAYAAGHIEVTPGQYVAISVSDTGTGMTPDVISRAFEPFYTTKPIGEGTGLGLSMVYGFARQSGGHVRIYSEPGQGTTVRLYLPRHWGEAEEDAAQPAAASVPEMAAGQTALIVDDEPVVRMLLSEVLTEMNFGVVEAADGPEALRAMQSARRFDLLVTDLGLPNGMNGRQLAEAARMLRRDLRVLFITGYAENAAVSSGALDPGMQVMTKPFALEALASKIRGMMTP